MANRGLVNNSKYTIGVKNGRTNCLTVIPVILIPFLVRWCLLMAAFWCTAEQSLDFLSLSSCLCAFFVPTLYEHKLAPSHLLWSSKLPVAHSHITIDSGMSKLRFLLVSGKKAWWHFHPNVPCVCVRASVLVHTVHMLHPVSEYPWQYHADNKRPPVPVC